MSYSNYVPQLLTSITPTSIKYIPHNVKGTTRCTTCWQKYECSLKHVSYVKEQILDHLKQTLPLKDTS